MDKQFPKIHDYHIKSKIAELYNKYLEKQDSNKYTSIIQDRIDHITKIATIEGCHYSVIVNLITEIECLLSMASELTYSDISIFAGNLERLNYFNRFSYLMDDKTYWKELATAYIMQDNLYVDLDFCILLFSADRTSKEELMSKDEKSFLKSLPNRFKIYRGIDIREREEGEYGISWTLNKKIAQRFSRRKLSPGNETTTGLVIEMEIEKKDVVAYFNKRKEEEIIYFDPAV